MNLKLKSQIRGGLKITKPKLSILMKKKNSWIKKFYYTNKRITMGPKKKDDKLEWWTITKAWLDAAQEAKLWLKYWLILECTRIDPKKKSLRPKQTCQFFNCFIVCFKTTSMVPPQIWNHPQRWNMCTQYPLFLKASYKSIRIGIFELFYFTISKINLSIIQYHFTLHPTFYFLFISSIH